MFCPNCGKELAEGEVCTCTAAENPVINPETAGAPEAPAAEIPEAEIPAEPAPQPQQPAGYYAPPVGGTYYQPPAPPQNGFVPPQSEAPYTAPQYAPAPVPARTDYPEGYHIKRKYVAVLLAFFFGFIGIHNFYLGDSNKAVAHILIATLGSLVFGLGFIASVIWAFVEAVQLLGDYTDRDAQGFKIQTFEEALVKTRMEAEEKKNNA